MGLSVPDLHDDAVALRPPTRDDVPAITAAVQDPDIPRFTMVPSPYSEADAVAYVESSQAAWRDASRASFVIVDPATGTLLGAVGIHHLDRAAGTAQVGYWVAAPARAAGVATRALRLTAAWALTDLGLHRLEAVVFTDNGRSGRVAERAGFVHQGAAPAPVEHPTGRRDAVVLVRTADQGAAVDGQR
jgi:RimJ/RimL family protein N-acetyltransferase